MITNIKIIDNGQERYLLNPSSLVLGRRYDNNADYITLEIPDAEKESVCTIIVSSFDKVIDHIIYDGKEVPIENNITQYASIKIGIAFTRADGYVKGSEIKKFTFLEAQKPDGFVPVDSKQKTNIDYLIQYGFTKCEREGDYFNFYNALGDVVSTISLGTFFQLQSDMSQENSNEVSYIKNKSTKYMKNEGEDGTSPYATQEFAKEHGGKIDKINLNGNPLPINENKSVNIDLNTTYYDKEYIDSKVVEIYSRMSGIPKFSIEVVDNLPVENIKTGVVYLLRSSDPEAGNLYIEYIFVNASWECLGSQKIDLTGYVKTSDLVDNYASKLYVLTAISEAGESLAAASVKDILNGTYLMHLNIDGIPTDLRAPIITGSLQDIAKSLDTIVAYNPMTNKQVGGVAQFVNPYLSFQEEGTRAVEVVFIPADRGYYYEYFTVDVEFY